MNAESVATGSAAEWSEKHFNASRFTLYPTVLSFLNRFFERPLNHENHSYRRFGFDRNRFCGL
jgi:hypothetical protein